MGAARGVGEEKRRVAWRGGGGRQGFVVRRGLDGRQGFVGRSGDDLKEGFVVRRKGLARRAPRELADKQRNAQEMVVCCLTWVQMEVLVLEGVEGVRVPVVDRKSVV